jgi:hypothetical protein
LNREAPVIAHFLALAVLALQAQSNTASIRGLVVAAGTSTPVPRAHVTILGQRMVQVDADDSGQFAVHDLQPGKYRVSAASEGYMTGMYGRRPGGGAGREIDLASGQDATGIVIGLTAKSFISGRVSDPNGDPVARIRVQILRYTYQDGQRILVLAGSATSDERGEYTFPSLAPGPYVVSVVPLDINAHLPVYFPGTTDVTTSSTIELPPGVNFTGVNIRLVDARPVHISGRVMNSLTGQPAANATVTLVPKRGTVSTGSTQRATASAAGAFEFQHMAPGSYGIVASLNDIGNRLATAEPIEVGSADIDNIALVLRSQITLTGKITVENQSTPVVDLSRVRVELRRQPFTPELLIVLPNVAPDGTFTVFGVTPGDYELKVNAGTAAYMKSARFGAIDALNPPFHVDAGVGQLDILISTNGGTLDAAVLDNNMLPIPEATVVLVPEPPLRNRMDLYDVKGSDYAGRAHLTDIAPGDYRIFAWGDIPADAWQDPDFVRPYESRGRLIHVSEGQLSTVQLELISRP